MVPRWRYLEVHPAAVHGTVSGYDVTYPQGGRRGRVPPGSATEHVVRPMRRRALYAPVVTVDKRRSELGKVCKQINFLLSIAMDVAREYVSRNNR